MFYRLCNMKRAVEELTQRLRAYIALRDDKGLVPRAHLISHS